MVSKEILCIVYIPLDCQLQTLSIDIFNNKMNIRAGFGIC